MACPRFKTQFDDPPENFGEVNNDPSMTVPDQALSIKDILYRFAEGLPLDDAVRRVSYGDDFEQHEDDFDVHPANTFDHDLLDLVDLNDESYAISPAKDNVTTINDDAKPAAPETGEKENP